MERLLVCIFAILCFTSQSIAKKGYGPGEQEWGFVQVRPRANMFWWLYYTTANVTSYYDKPLIVWLQGGPGQSSTAIGNFGELGPLDLNLKPRNHTWVKDYNVLFIDNPVGAGFSYAEALSGFPTTNTQVAEDLLECIKAFYIQLPKFKPVPTYIAGQSYGGKMGAEFALVWDRAQKAGTIESNLKGVALGDAWISSIDSVMTYAPYLFNLGFIDKEDYNAIDDVANKTKDKIEQGKLGPAFYYFCLMLVIITEKTNNIDYYNVLTKMNYMNSYYLSSQNELSFDEGTIDQHLTIEVSTDLYTQSLDDLMNGPVKKALGLNVSHGTQEGTIYQILQKDFMQPVNHIVEQLLNETSLKVFVYNGQLDLIVSTLGTLRWVENLNWQGADTWKISEMHPLISEEFIEGYYKVHDKLCLYWVDRAGHSVPISNPAAMEVILQSLTNTTNTTRI